MYTIYMQIYTALPFCLAPTGFFLLTAKSTSSVSPSVSELPFDLVSESSVSVLKLSDEKAQKFEMKLTPKISRIKKYFSKINWYEYIVFRMRLGVVKE